MKRRAAPAPRDWFVYLLRCADGSLYCGITPSLPARLLRHNAGKGAKYTRARGPVYFVYAESLRDYSSALQREYQLKQLTRSQKERLLSRDGNPDV